MLLFTKKLDPIIKLKLKEKDDKTIPVIITLKEPPSNRFKNSISKNRGKLKYEYKTLNGLAAQLNIDQVDRISELPEVLCISYDRKAYVCMDKTPGYVGINYSNPYSLTGRGINIAIIDTGVYPHGDLMRPYKTILSFKDFVNSIVEPYDDNGHGTHICGIITGSGVMGEDRYKGIAQNSRIIMLKAFNNVGEGSFSDILASIDWVIQNKEKYNIKMMCLPFGAEAIVPPKRDPLSIACDIAWSSGIIVVAASGNKGPSQGTITTPGICSSIITVGCCECPDTNIRNWKIPDFSARGTKKDSEVKPEIIAPGVNVISLSSDKSYIPGKTRFKSLDTPYCSMTGTSVSCGVAAGCIALFLEKMPSVSVNDLKGILKFGCQTLNESKTSQGFGVISMQKLLNE